MLIAGRLMDACRDKDEDDDDVDVVDEGCCCCRLVFVAVFVRCENPLNECR